MEQPSTEGVPMTPPASYARYRRLDSLTRYMALKAAQNHWFFSEGAARIHMALIEQDDIGRRQRLLAHCIAPYSPSDKGHSYNRPRGACSH